MTIPKKAAIIFALLFTSVVIFMLCLCISMNNRSKLDFEEFYSFKNELQQNNGKDGFVLVENPPFEVINACRNAVQEKTNSIVYDDYIYIWDNHGKFAFSYRFLDEYGTVTDIPVSEASNVIAATIFCKRDCPKIKDCVYNGNLIIMEIEL